MLLLCQGLPTGNGWTDDESGNTGGNDHWTPSDSGGHLGAFQAGLWRHRAHRPPGLPYAPSAIDTECSGTADLSFEIRRSHHWCACHLSLAVRPRTDHIQDRRADVQSPPQKCAAAPGTPHSSVRSARLTDAVLYRYQSATRTTR